jgi:hypothetical protein
MQIDYFFPSAGLYSFVINCRGSFNTTKTIVLYMRQVSCVYKDLHGGVNTKYKHSCSVLSTLLPSSVTNHYNYVLLIGLCFTLRSSRYDIHHNPN